MLHRHGSRYPTTDAGVQKFGEALTKSIKAGAKFTGELSFLNNWSYELGWVGFVQTSAIHLPYDKHSITSHHNLLNHYIQQIIILAQFSIRLIDLIHIMANTEIGVKY